MNISNINSKLVNILGKALCLPLFFFSLELSAKELSLELIKELVWKNNLFVQVAKVDQQLAEAELQAALYPLDSKLGVSYFVEKSHTPQNSSLENLSVNDTTTGVSIGIDKSFKTATELSFGLQSFDRESDSRNAIANSWNQTAGVISIKQPILKGRSKYNFLSELEIAKINKRKYHMKLKKVFSEQIKKVLDLYLDLIIVSNEIDIANENIRIYENLYNFYDKASRLGNKSKLRRLEATSLLEKERSLSLVKKSKFKKIESKIQNSLGIDYVIKAPSNIDNILSFEIPSKQLKENSYKINELLSDIDQQKIKVLKAKDLSLPDLSLDLEYLSPGLTSSQNDSLDIVTAVDYPNFTISLNFTWKFGNSYANGLLAKENAKLNRITSKYYNELRKQNDTKSIYSFSKGISNEIINISETQLSNSEKMLTIQKKMYQLGKVSVLDLEQSIKELGETKMSIINELVKNKKKLNQVAHISQLYY